MNIRHLRIFKTVCDCSSITKAAEKLYLSQPAVSHVISELEKELSVQLFERISKRIYLTQEGKLLLEKATVFLEYYNDLKESTKNLSHQTILRVGSSITLSNFVLPNVIKEMETIFGNSSTAITIDNAKNIEKLILKNEIDVALIEGTISEKKLIKIPFSSYPLVVFCSKKHHFSTQKEISIAQLAQEKILLREKGSSIRDCFDSAMLLHHIVIEPVWVSVNSQALIEAVKYNLGISILPEILIHEFLQQGELKKVFVKDFYLESMNYIVYHKEKHLSEKLKTFLEIIKKQKSNF